MQKHLLHEGITKKRKKLEETKKERGGGTQTDTGYPVFPVHHTHVLGKLIHVYYVGYSILL